MQFRTEINIPPLPFTISHGDRILPLGSCFSEHIAKLLDRTLFHVVPNPFGTSYNPVSLSEQIHRIRLGKSYQAEDLNHHDGTYFSFSHYTAFSDPDPEPALHRMNEALRGAHESLPKTRLLMLTLGTAHAWKNRSLDKIVNNCHRVPGKEFDRVLLSVETITKQLGAALDSLTGEFPQLQVLLTVSPVRHLRDGAVANQRSKAILLVAAHELAKTFESVSYFPSYELMMDDLRDYRFYTEDMLHPTDQAVDYIWNKFSDSVISEASRKSMQSVAPIVRFLEHRPKNARSAAHRSNVERMKQLIQQEKSRIPDADWRRIEEWMNQERD